jgi:serine phosphatase RsbU (regulator of sigma subunit)
MVALESVSQPDQSVGADERVFNELFHHNPMPLVVTSFDRDLVLAVNRRAGDAFFASGFDPAAMPVTSWYVDPADRAFVQRALQTVGHLDDHQLQLRRRDGSVLHVQASCRRVSWAGEPAILTGFADLTPQLQAEEALAASERRLASQSRTLTTLTERWASGAAFEDRVNEILRMAADTLVVERLSVWAFARDSRFIECLALHQRSALRHAVGSRIAEDDCPAYFEALDAERVIAAHDARTDPRTAGFASWYLEPNHIGAMLDVPLRHSGGMQGVLCAEHVGEARTWTLDEQNFALAVANLIAVAMADAERSRALTRLVRELASAGRMQAMILPPALPIHDRVRFAACYQTSRHAGGDYYDVIPIDENRFAVIVADVSGHGANAAIVMAMIRAVTHTYPGPIGDPSDVLSYLNRHFQYLWDTAMYATAVVAVLDLDRQVIRVASAGHPPPLVIRDGAATPFPAVNAPLLFWQDLPDIPVVEEPLCPGDRVVFYTDGITDRRGPDDSRFETERVMETLAQASHLDLASMMGALNLKLEAFACAAEPDDDQTVLSIESCR